MLFNMWFSLGIAKALRPVPPTLKGNGDTGGGKFQPAQKSVGLDFGGDSTGSGKFKLISRRDRKRAGAVMVQATKKMSQEDRRLGISVLDYVPEMAE